MTGVTDLPIRVCDRCGATWMEDPQMYEDVDRCPGCGTRATTPAYEGKTEEIEY